MPRRVSLRQFTRDLDHQNERPDAAATDAAGEHRCAVNVTAAMLRAGHPTP
jgi:hypothetical protein